MAYIKLYFAKDDSVVSEAGTFTNAVEFILHADLREEKSERLYAMADTGYLVTSTEVTPTGTTASKWALAPDSSGEAGTYGAWGAKLTLGSVGAGDGKVYFWVKAKATEDEVPVNDTSVTLNVEGIAGAV